MESLQSGFQLEQLKLNLFFWGCFDPSSYQHKRRTTFLTAGAALLVCYTAVFRGGALRDDTKDGCVADYCLMRLLARWNKNGVYIFSSSRMSRFIHCINT